MPNRRLLLFILLFASILFRFYDLGIRPPHHDESVNGWFVDGLFKNGFYNYDPQNYHGPLYFYFLAFMTGIFGRSVEVLRSVTVVFGGLLTLMPFLYRKWIGERAAWIAAFALAWSPAVVFYSRYAIHEIPFSFFTGLFVYFWLKAREEEFNRNTVIGLGLSLGAMAGIKENFVIVLGCLFVAEIMVRIYGKEFQFPKKYSWNAFLILIAFGMILLVYSAMGRDTDGVVNFFKAFEKWTETGSKGNGHEKPIFYWFKLLAKQEWPALIGLGLAPFALKKVNPGFRLFSVLFVGIFLAYSIVNYKTPWCILSFHWGLILIFSYWVSEYFQKYQYAIVGLLMSCGVYSVYQAYDVSYVHVDSDDSPYIYGQTYHDLMIPVSQILDQVKREPAKKDQMRIQVISQFTWPLPYVFGEIKQVGYHGENNAPEKLDADYLLIDQNLEEKFKSRIAGKYQREVARSRQWAAPMVIYRKI